MNLINVPYIAQPKNSAMCGAACIAMLMRFYIGEKVSVKEVWDSVKDISPELNREYCKTYKLGSYLNSKELNCSIIKYGNLRDFLEFSISNGIAPIVNHMSFRNARVGHFTVVKNIVNDQVILNDPEDKKNVSVPLRKLELAATKLNESQEIGGDTAIVLTGQFQDKSIRNCPYCSNFIDITFTTAANQYKNIIKQDLCLFCDRFS